MAWIIFVVTAVAILVIAVVTVGWAVGRLSVEPPTSVFDEDEAVEWIADRLPFDVAAQLSHDDVRQLVVWHLDTSTPRGWPPSRPSPKPPTPWWWARTTGLAYVLGRATEAGLDADDVQIVAVLETERAYLEAIGAIGPQVAECVSPSS